MEILYPLTVFTPFKKTIYIGLVEQIVTNIENMEKGEVEKRHFVTMQYKMTIFISH
jgi:hypothetical protein